MKAGRILRKLLVFLIGFPLLVVGIVLIPLPGPGLLISLLALTLLSTELAWTKPFMERRQRELKKWWHEYRRRQQEINNKYE